MERYSYQASQRKKRVDKITHTLVKFHLTHQNLILFILGIIFAYLLVKSQVMNDMTLSLTRFGYGSAFVLGFLFSFGSFTIPATTALFILSSNFNPFLVALTAATAATISNFLIYKFIKDEVLEEIKSTLAKSFKIDVLNIEQKINRGLYRSHFLKSAVPALSGILVSLPLPTEFLVSMLWIVARYDTKKVLFYSFIFSFLGILGIAFFSHGVS